MCPLSGALIRDWIIVKPNNSLKDRIKEWARRQMLDLDAIEVAALKLRRQSVLGQQWELGGRRDTFKEQHGGART